MCGWVEGLGVWLGGEAGCVAGWRGWGVKGVHPRPRKPSAAVAEVEISRLITC